MIFWLNVNFWSQKRLFIKKSWRNSNVAYMGNDYCICKAMCALILTFNGTYIYVNKCWTYLVREFCQNRVKHTTRNFKAEYSYWKYKKISIYHVKATINEYSVLLIQKLLLTNEMYDFIQWVCLLMWSKHCHFKKSSTLTFGQLRLA